eukprot:TRINITY_DN5031_c0_g1_i1.p1 TRINITY_DN5031_c0_g1~~TRINITY_DN5031_c0_g1_i1.p1  ORF type:complete len:429 (+),score=164.88 TRINITY_DN5031_c0_g1_i1:30-1289(+)
MSGHIGSITISDCLKPLVSSAKASPSYTVLLTQRIGAKCYVLGAIPIPQSSFLESDDACPHPLESFWISENCTQISRMLPGGVFIGGLMYHPAARHDRDSASINIISEIASSARGPDIPKAIREHNTSDSALAFSQQWIIASYQPEAKKFSWRSINVKTKDVEEIDVVEFAKFALRSDETSDSILMDKFVTKIPISFQIQAASSKTEFDKSIKDLSAKFLQRISQMEGIVTEKSPSQIKLTTFKSQGLISDSNKNSQSLANVEGFLCAVCYLIDGGSTQDAIQLMKDDLCATLQHRFDIISTIGEIHLISNDIGGKLYLPYRSEFHLEIPIMTKDIHLINYTFGIDDKQDTFDKIAFFVSDQKIKRRDLKALEPRTKDLKYDYEDAKRPEPIRWRTKDTLAIAGGILLMLVLMVIKSQS